NTPHPTKWHLQQLEARSRRRSGPRARVRDIAAHNQHLCKPQIHPRGHIATCRIQPPISSNRFRSWKRPFARVATNSHIVKDKANHAVVLDKQTNDKLQKDVGSYRLITVATLVDRLKINGSLARKALADLEEAGQIKKVVGHSKLSIYSTSHYSS
ncbi:hypothetical protein T440DRAFT_558542, partial [Plenodomus tracheiphilus IPT5]